MPFSGSRRLENLTGFASLASFPSLLHLGVLALAWETATLQLCFVAILEAVGPSRCAASFAA